MLRRIAVSTVAALALLAAGCHRHRKTTSVANTTDYADNLRTVVARPQLAILHWPNYSDYQPAVTSFYDDRNYEIAWLRDLKPTVQATAFIKAFQDAGAKGLNSDDYDAWLWPARLQQLEKIAGARDTSNAAQDTVAQFDTAMTVCVMRYISDLRIGRVNPQHFNFDIDVAQKKYDLAEFVSDNAVDASDVPGLIRKVEPDSDQYRATEAAINHYLDLARTQAAANAPPLPEVNKPGVSPGGSYPEAGQLLARLQLEGDAPGDYPYHAPSAPQQPVSQPAATKKPRLGSKTIARAQRLIHRNRASHTANATEVAATSPAAAAFNPPDLPPIYTAELSEAVKLYQHRHALVDDGKLTPDTIKSLNVPLTERVVQLQDSLERWRWLPNQYVNAPLMVNLPEFVLRGYTPDHKVDFTMKVVVGKVVGDHDTPVFAHMMKYLIVRPYWNVPHDIVEKELMPHIRAKGVGYLASKNFEVTDNKGTVLTGYTAQQIEHGGLQVREKPGPKNSLGLVKFMFPNQYDIYGYDQKLQEVLSKGPPYPVKPDPAMPVAKPGDTA